MSYLWRGPRPRPVISSGGGFLPFDQQVLGVICGCLVQYLQQNSRSLRQQCLDVLALLLSRYGRCQVGGDGSNGLGLLSLETRLTVVGGCASFFSENDL